MSPKDAPGHGTFNRVPGSLHWHDFESAVREWTRTLLPPGSPGKEREPEQYCSGGKVQRGSRTADPVTGQNRFVATVNV